MVARAAAPRPGRRPAGEPVVLRWAVGCARPALLTRTVISVGDDAEVSVVEEQVGPDAPPVRRTRTRGRDFGRHEPQAFFAGTTEIRLGQGSTLSFAGLQDFAVDQVAFQHRSAVLAKGATVRWALAQLGSRVIRSRIDNRLEGDGSTVEQAEIVFGSADQLFDLTSYTRHIGRDTTGNLLSKGALADRSRAYIKGLATIDKPAHGTDSFLGEFAMLLSKQARSVAIPSLEIDQPDCRRVAHVELGRPDRRDAALLPGEPRHRAGRSPQVHRAGLPRAGGGARDAAGSLRIGCASCSRPSGRRRSASTPRTAVA